MYIYIYNRIQSDKNLITRLLPFTGLPRRVISVKGAK